MTVADLERVNGLSEAELDALAQRLDARRRAPTAPAPLVNVRGEVISPLAAAGRIQVAPGQTIASTWGNLVYGQTVNVFASTADRDQQWAAPADGAVCYTIAEAATFLRRAGVWAPWACSGLAALGAGAPLASSVDVAGDAWVAKGGVNGGAWRKARDVLHAFYTNTGAFNVGTAAGAIGYNVAQNDPYGMYTTANGQFSPPVTGVYAVTVSIGATAPAAGQYLQAQISDASGFYMGQDLSSGANQVLVAAATLARKFTAGSPATTRMQAAAVMAGRAVGDTTYLSIDYLGTG